MKLIILLVLFSFPSYAINLVPVKKGVFEAKEEGFFVSKVEWASHLKKYRQMERDLEIFKVQIGLLEKKVTLKDQLIQDWKKRYDLSEKRADVWQNLSIKMSGEYQKLLIDNQKQKNMFLYGTLTGVGSSIVVILSVIMVSKYAK